MAKKRPSFTTVFIACEGSNTEPSYFESLKETMEEEDNYPYAITVYPNKEFDKKPKTDAIGLVNIAIERKDDYDESWVVFDKNGYTKHKDAFVLAQENNINIAFSSISFEFWVLLHFERNNSAFSKSKNIINEKFCNHETYLGDYAKSGDYHVYPKIKDKTIDAFKNVSWLRNWLHSINSNHTIYNVNPYSDVDVLVKKLLLDDFVYEFRQIGQSLTFKNIKIEVNKVNNECVVKITNLTQKGLLWNQFHFYDVAKNKIGVKNAVIEVGTSDKRSLGQLDKLFIEFENLKLEVSL